ncbi:MAG: hypothetical protein SFU86_14175 [Pirellulaceae bacterium]|nr:hypothetical protein [Pirellulaceae bacterium]
MRRAIGLAVVWGLGLVGVAAACGPYSLVLEAIESYPSNPAVVEQIRERGPQALADLLVIRGQMQRQLEKLSAAKPPVQDEIDPLARRLVALDELIDRVGKQRYCSRSGLYWYTDLEQAQAAAQKSGRPILSLRMLGKLDEDFSCANSRFFRTTLYANDEISRVLRRDYVLHWESVRPVPKVTIDFGDGRKLERTLTGNSVHYILTSDGDVVDALPGLYGPQSFLAKISEVASVAKVMSGLVGTERREALARYHGAKLTQLDEAWRRDMERIGIAAESARLREDLNRTPAAPAGQPPRADAAARVAMPKERIERRLVAAAIPVAATPEAASDERTWAAVAELHAAEAKLDNASRDLIRSENPTAAVAGRLAITKRVVEDPLLALVRSLESSIALDTVRNEYRLHRQLHGWLAEAGYHPDVATLNERVYAELFLTPSSDPWLGLAPADVYTALPNGGVVRQ